MRNIYKKYKKYIQTYIQYTLYESRNNLNK